MHDVKELCVKFGRRSKWSCTKKNVWKTQAETKSACKCTCRLPVRLHAEFFDVACILPGC